jgi:hypothetical protein
MSDLKEAKNKASTTINANRDPAAGVEIKETKSENEYETILNCISDLINNDASFSQYAKSEIY